MQQHSPTYEVKVFLHMDLLYELIKYVNSCLWHFECQKKKNDTIHVIVDHRVCICPFNVNKCDVTDTLLRRQVFNLRNALNDRSAEHNVAGITLENNGNLSNRSFSCIVSSISGTVMQPNPRTQRKLAYIFSSASRISPSIL